MELACSISRPQTMAKHRRVYYFSAIKCKEGNYVEKGFGMFYLKAADNGKTQASLLF
jgi:hypothetical protein